MRFPKPTETAVKYIRDGSTVRVRMFNRQTVVAKVCPHGVIMTTGGVKIRIVHGSVVNVVPHSQVVETIEY